MGDIGLLADGFRRLLSSYATIRPRPSEHAFHVEGLKWQVVLESSRSDWDRFNRVRKATSPLDSLVTTIQERLESVQERIEQACQRSGRSSSDITLIAVTKTFPSEIVQAGVVAGLTDFGENRVQELVAKSDVVPGEALGGSVRWHLIGPLQRNKAKEAARRADCFHALDSVRLAKTLDQRAELSDRVIPCLLQVNVSGEATKSGVQPKELPALLDDLTSFAHLQIQGLMTLAAPARSETELETLVRSQFKQLRQLAEESTGRHLSIRLKHLSMGMSGDFEVAIEEGATHIRLGSVLFGMRDS